jgi:DNA repair exonuclease SbcCD nuclease subunit
MTNIRIAHFSDVHMAMAPNWSTINVNRFFSWGRWVATRRRHHSIERLDRVIQMVIEANPHLVICTGDLSHTGLPYELAAVSEKFDLLTQKKIPMLLTGGNHDYYNRSACDEIARLQEKHGLDLKIDNDGICQRGDVKILCLDQAIYNPFYMARGTLIQETLGSIENRLQAGQLSQINLAVGHYPVCDASGRPISIRKRLGGDQRLKQFLQAQQIPAYLCGHLHKPFSIALADGCVQYCAGSITNAGVLRMLQYQDGQLIEEQTPVIDLDKRKN